MSDNNNSKGYWSSLHNSLTEKKKKPYSKNTQIQGVEIFFEDEDENDVKDNNNYNIEKKAKEEKSKSIPIYTNVKNPQGQVQSYTPENQYLLNCTIQSWQTNFRLYKDFVDDAQKYYTKTCASAEYIYFFSFRSQFRELNPSQLGWYLYWRSKVRSGEYPKTGLSYIFLYVYELINLCEIIGEEKTLHEMIALWKAYRDEFPRIDKYLIEWITDFVLVNKLEMPLNLFKDTLTYNDLKDIILPEIFVSNDFFSNFENIEVIISTFSQYKYTSSKYYTPKTKEFFDTHIPNVVFKSFDCDEMKELISKDGLKRKNIRESFSGAVCTYDKKKKITVEHINLFDNDILKKYITEIIRLTENIIREHLKIKSRLNQVALPQGIMNVIENYKKEHFKNINPIVGKNKSTSNVSAATPKVEVEVYEFNATLETALNIEERSWKTTQTLVELQNDGEDSENEHENEYEEVLEKFDNIEDFDSTDVEFEELSLAKTLTDELNDCKDSETAVSEYVGIVRSLTHEERELLKILLESYESEDSNETDTIIKISNFSKEYNVLSEFTIENINSKAMDFLGDVIFDVASNSIVDEYFKDLYDAFKAISN